MADISEAIKSASEAASKEYSELQAAEPAETKTEATPAAESEPAAAATPEPAETKEAPPKDDENLLNLSKDDLEEIEKDPLLRKAYKTMVRGMNEKARALAADRQKNAEDLQLLNWFRADPDNALRTMARIRGLDMGTAPQGAQAPVVDKVTKDMEAAIGPQMTAVLKPVIEGIVKAVVDTEVKPAKAELEQIRQATTEAGIEQVLQTFVAELHENDEDFDESVNDEMAELANKTRKADGVPLKDHLRFLYNSVMYNRAQKQALSTEISRIREAKKKGGEPVNTVRPAGPSEKGLKDFTRLEDKIAFAVELARRENG